MAIFLIQSAFKIMIIYFLCTTFSFSVMILKINYRCYNCNLRNKNVNIELPHKNEWCYEFRLFFIYFFDKLQIKPFEVWLAFIFILSVSIFSIESFNFHLFPTKNFVQSVFVLLRTPKRHRFGIFNFYVNKKGQPVDVFYN